MSTKFKSATVTWISYNNFGTYLQAYALQKTLLGIGVDNKILSDHRFVSSRSIRALLGTVKDYLFSDRFKSSKYYRNFKKKYLSIDTNWTKKSIERDYDIFVCGSDQIWSPYITFNPFYYLGFTSKKKIAYAPSTGTGYCNAEYETNVKSFIESFSHVSVREEDGLNMLSRFINKDISVVLDPTLLLDAKDWDVVSSPLSLNHNYILCYFLTPNKTYLNYVSEYAKKHNLNVKIFNTDEKYKNLGFEIIDAGPGEFITYIKNANIIFTDSFHSTIFSILYSKEFITFKRFRDGGENDQNSRVNNLLTKLGVCDRFIGENDISNIENMIPLNYTNILARLSALRERSKEYLYQAIFD